MDRWSVLAITAACTLGLAQTSNGSHAPPAGKVYRVGLRVNQGANVGGKPYPQVASLRQGLT